MGDEGDFVIDTDSRDFYTGTVLSQMQQGEGRAGFGQVLHCEDGPTTLIGLARSVAQAIDMLLEVA